MDYWNISSSTQAQLPAPDTTPVAEEQKEAHKAKQKQQLAQLELETSPEEQAREERLKKDY